MAFAYNQPGYQDPETGLWQSENPTPPLAHGVLRTLMSELIEAQTDYNADNYTIAGRRHMLPRFSDLDVATTTTPASNTIAGWEALTGGARPILTNTDFNAFATETNTTLVLTGGPTQSGAYLRRQITESAAATYTNIRLRNWCIFPTEEFHGKIHVSFLSFGMDEAIGKIFRMYWTGGDNLWDNVWVARTNQDYSARAEYSGGGVIPQLDADNTGAVGWVRDDFFFDFDTGLCSFYIDGELLIDTSSGHTGELDWLGVGGVLDYILLGNTISAGRTGAGTVEYPYVYNDEYTAWALFSVSFSHTRIEMADSPTWAEKTGFEIQPFATCETGEAQYIVNQGRFADLADKSLFLVDKMNATYLGAAT